MLSSIREYLVEFKIFWQRGVSYLSLVNSSMILFVFLSGLEQYGIDLPIRAMFVPLIIAGIIGIVLLGYVEDKAGFYRTEQKRVQYRNPQMQEVLKKLTNIEHELELIKRKK